MKNSIAIITVTIIGLPHFHGVPSKAWPGILVTYVLLSFVTYHTNTNNTLYSAFLSDGGLVASVWARPPQSPEFESHDELATSFKITAE